MPHLALLQAEFSPLHAALRGGLIGVGTLAILLAMSVFSWGVFLTRRRALRAARHDSARLREAFLAAADTESFARACRGMPDSAARRLFLDAHEHHEEVVAAVAPRDGVTDVARVTAGREMLTRTLAGSRARELAASRRGLVLLATVGATAPFVGLFGTVWGIVKAFAAIGAMKSADLAVVAPGIAEALVATAAGLLAAIPAVWFFNSLSANVRGLGTELDALGVEVLNVYDRAVAMGGERR